MRHHTPPSAHVPKHQWITLKSEMIIHLHPPLPLRRLCCHENLPIMDSSESFWRLTWVSGLVSKDNKPYLWNTGWPVVSTVVSAHTFPLFSSNTAHPTFREITRRRHFPRHAANYLHFTALNCYLCIMWVKSEYKWVLSVSFVLVNLLKVSQEWLNLFRFQCERSLSSCVTLTTACCLFVTISGLSYCSDWQSFAQHHLCVCQIFICSFW